MAQRLVHYAIAKNLLDKNIIKDEYKFVIGSLIPDCNEHTDEHYNFTHNVVINANKKTIDFNAFLKKYREEILNNELYLGYYIHLITDALYRDFMYNIKELRKYRTDEDFYEKLYSDYNALNRILINKYNLEPINIDKNIIPLEFDLADISIFQQDFDNDFTKEYDINKLYYLTKEITFEFIDYAVEILYNHVVDIENNNIKLLELYWW